MVTKPNFIGIGGHKCASTWLSELLRSHPEVFLSNPKEIGFFTDHYEKGFEWYLKHFNNVKSEKAIGEFTSYYIYSEEALNRIYNMFGEIKCILIVREPIPRALSQIKHGIRKKIINKPVNKVISLNELKEMIVVYPEIISRSFYSEGITRFKYKMGDNNILIINQSDIKNNNNEIINKICKFLLISNDFNFTTSNIGEGIIPRFQFFESFRRTIFRLTRNIPGIVPFIKKSGLSSYYRKINNGSNIEFSDECKKYLEDQFSTDWENTKIYIYNNK